MKPSKATDVMLTEVRSDPKINVIGTMTVGEIVIVKGAGGMIRTSEIATMCTAEIENATEAEGIEMTSGKIATTKEAEETGMTLGQIATAKGTEGTETISVSGNETGLMIAGLRIANESVVKMNDLATAEKRSSAAG